MVIRDAALSILGAATPAELATALSSADWFNGNLARFSLLTPETDYRERDAATESPSPTDLANRLKRLHEKLPEPSLPDATGDKQFTDARSLVADIWPQVHTYEQALRSMTAPSSSLDDRLRAIYGRLHVQAIKVAILLAALIGQIAVISRHSRLINLSPVNKNGQHACYALALLLYICTDCLIASDMQIAGMMGMEKQKPA